MNENDLRQKGLYYAENLNDALRQFNDRLSHEIVVIDETIIKDSEGNIDVDLLKKNLIKMSNRVLVVCDDENKTNNLQGVPRNIVFINKKDIDGFGKPIDVYYKMRFLWIEKFFNIDNNNCLKIYLILEKPLEKEWQKQQKKSENFNNSIKVDFKTPSLEQNEIILDHHDSYYRSNSECIKKKLNSAILDLYYEAWEKSSYLSFVFNSPPQSEDDFLERILEFSEMGLLKIIVIDERIAEKSINKQSSRFSLWKALKLQQVYIVSHLGENGNEKPISNNITEKANILNIADNDIKINNEKINNGFHCLIIHKSILANPDFSSVLGIKNNNLEEWIDEMKKHFPIVILDSGRGEADIPMCAKFLPYSYLEDVLIENTSKYKLTKTILKLVRKIT